LTDSQNTLTVLVMRKQNTLTQKELIERLKRMQGDRSLREFADDLGVSAAYLSDVYRGNRAVGKKLCKKLNVTKTREFVTTYREGAPA